MIAYIDSSALLRCLLGEPGAIDIFDEAEYFVSSMLLKVECLRTVDRLRLRAGLSDEAIVPRKELLFQTLLRVELIEISESVLNQASQPFSSNLGTLDAIHLASAMLWQTQTKRSLTLFTHDRELDLAARAQGFSCIGVV